MNFGALAEVLSSQEWISPGCVSDWRELQRFYFICVYWSMTNWSILDVLVVRRTPCSTPRRRLLLAKTKCSTVDHVMGGGGGG